MKEKKYTKEQKEMSNKAINKFKEPFYIEII